MKVSVCLELLLLLVRTGPPSSRACVSPFRVLVEPGQDPDKTMTNALIPEALRRLDFGCAGDTDFNRFA